MEDTGRDRGVENQLLQKFSTARFEYEDAMKLKHIHTHSKRVVMERGKKKENNEMVMVL